MSIWRSEHGRRNATAHTLAILESIEQKMFGYARPRPSVKSIRIGAGPHDQHDFEVEVELAPGAVVAVRYQSVDEEDRRPDDLENESGAVACLVNATVRDFLNLEIEVDALADQLHDLRVETRRTLAEWRASGINVSLIDIRFVCTEYWIPARELVVEARFRSLNHYLKPCIVAKEVEHPDHYLTELPTWRQGFEVPFAMQSALARQGADGMVDRLVLNAIAQYEDADTAWRAIASGRVYWGSERLTVFTSEGHVKCHGRSSDGRFSWNRCLVDVYGQTLPETVAKSLRGRPITSVVEHPVLSDDMIICAVSSTSDFTGDSVRLEFDQPLLLFCSASGRIWAADPETTRDLKDLAGCLTDASAGLA